MKAVDAAFPMLILLLHAQECGSYGEADLVRAFKRISQNSRASAVTLGDTCRQIWRHDTWWVRVTRVRWV